MTTEQPKKRDATNIGVYLDRSVIRALQRISTDPEFAETIDPKYVDRKVSWLINDMIKEKLGLVGEG